MIGRIKDLFFGKRLLMNLMRNLFWIMLKKILFFGDQQVLRRFGFQGLKEYLEFVRSVFEGYTVEVISTVCEDNKVVNCLRFRGRHIKKFLGIEPTNKNISYDAVAVITFEGDKIDNIWVLGDMLSVLEQMRGDYEA